MGFRSQQADTDLNGYRWFSTPHHLIPLFAHIMCLHFSRTSFIAMVPAFSLLIFHAGAGLR